jgi:outer membrane protein OmpA-like peptidoglycan-associated protein
MADEFGFETGSPGVYQGYLEELLDQLEVQETGGHEPMIYEDRLEELLDRLEAQEAGGYLSEVTSSSKPRPGATTPPCPARTAGAQPVVVLDRFDFDKDKLKPLHDELVQRIARQVAMSWSSPRPIEVIRLVGHTDPVGTDNYNLALGLRRAREVQSALWLAIELQRRVHWRARVTNVTKLVIIPDSQGARDPVGNNRTPEGRACNRRVEVFLETKAAPPPPPPPGPTGPLPGTPTIRHCSLSDPDCGPPVTTTPVPEPPQSPITQRPGQTLPPLPPSSGKKPTTGEMIRKKLDDALSGLPAWMRGPVRNLILNSASEFALSQGLQALGITGAAQNAFLAVWRALKQ